MLGGDDDIVSAQGKSVGIASANEDVQPGQDGRLQKNTGCAIILFEKKVNPYGEPIVETDN